MLCCSILHLLVKKNHGWRYTILLYYKRVIYVPSFMRILIRFEIDLRIHHHNHRMHIYIHIYIYVEREQERGRETERGKQREKYFVVGPKKDFKYFKMRRSTKRFVYLEFIYSFCFYTSVCFELDAFVKEHVWHKDYLMGYSMRLELTQFSSLNGFHLFWVCLWILVLPFS